MDGPGQPRDRLREAGALGDEVESPGADGLAEGRRPEPLRSITGVVGDHALRMVGRDHEHRGGPPILNGLRQRSPVMALQLRLRDHGALDDREQRHQGHRRGQAPPLPGRGEPDRADQEQRHERHDEVARVDEIEAGKGEPEGNRQADRRHASGHQRPAPEASRAVPQQQQERAGQQNEARDPRDSLDRLRAGQARVRARALAGDELDCRRCHAIGQLDLQGRVGVMPRLLPERQRDQRQADQATAAVAASARGRHSRRKRSQPASAMKGNAPK